MRREEVQTRGNLYFKNSSLILAQITCGVSYVLHLFSHRRLPLPTCMAFETLLGDMLAVGFKNGEVRILRTDTLQDVLTFKHSGDAVATLKFSPSGIYLAGFDESHCTLLFKRCLLSWLITFLTSIIIYYDWFVLLLFTWCFDASGLQRRSWLITSSISAVSKHIRAR